MKISIIREDKCVVKDGVGITGLTLSSCPSDVWAVQWDTTTSTGTVEMNDLSVSTITELGIYQSCVDEFDTEKAKLDAEAAAAAAPPPAAINTQVPKGSGGLVQISRRKRAGTRRFSSATASAAARGSNSGTSSQRFLTVFGLLPQHLANGAAAPGRSRTDQGCVAP